MAFDNLSELSKKKITPTHIDIVYNSNEISYFKMKINL